MAEQLLVVTKKPLVYTATHLAAAGFEYTGHGDTARCKRCGLEVSNWTLDMDPLNIHWEKKSDCPYTQYFVAAQLLSAFSYSSTLNEYENVSIQQKIETIISEYLSDILVETDSLQQVRKRTFSHWPHRISPSSEQMIDAGFFNCNVSDRVICVYCNIICQKWEPYTDDPWKVHKTLSPNCGYVQAKLIHFVTAPIPIINENSAEGKTIDDYELLRLNLLTPAAVRHPAYAMLPKRVASFATWSKEDSPSIDDMVRAGFFYTGKKDIIMCFYCGGLLQEVNHNTNPMIAHAGWFPHCGYAKQLCGDERYNKIQIHRTKQQANLGAVTKINPIAYGKHSSTSDEDTLSKLVAAKLDSPISQRLLDQDFKLSIIKRCWEDQLRLKEVDFVSEEDLFMACLILQKQIEHIDGKLEKIIIPNKKMIEIKKQSQELFLNLLITSIVSLSSSVRPVLLVDSQNETEMIFSNYEQTSNLCVLCLHEEKQLACMPCGHLTTCVPCGHFLRSCSMCHKKVQAFARIYN